MKTLLQLLGLRTDCCNAKVISWHRNKHYCQKCERWLDVPVQATAKVKQASKTRIAH